LNAVLEPEGHYHYETSDSDCRLRRRILDAPGWRLRHADRVQIVAACDVDTARVKQAQQKYDCARLRFEYEEMIAEAEWDVAIVCTPTSVREAVVATLAAAGSMFCGKAVGLIVEEGSAWCRLREGGVLWPSIRISISLPLFTLPKSRLRRGIAGAFTLYTISTCASGKTRVARS
jgi:hypothetical protein